jgi:hypothetical protein
MTSYFPRIANIQIDFLKKNLGLCAIYNNLAIVRCSPTNLPAGKGRSFLPQRQAKKDLRLSSAAFHHFIFVQQYYKQY